MIVPFIEIFFLKLSSSLHKPNKWLGFSVAVKFVLLFLLVSVGLSAL